MNPATLIENAHADGLEVWLDGNRLKLRGTQATVARWTPELAVHKGAIIGVLKAPTLTAWHWLTHFADREPLEIYCYPDASLGNVLPNDEDISVNASREGLV